jgi:hypothetical protein
MAGFSGQKDGTRVPTQLTVKVESGGCSGRVDGSASCCMLRSPEEYCTCSRQYAVCGVTSVVVLTSFTRYARARARTHTHTHTQFICAHNTLFLPVCTTSAAGHVLATRLSRVSLSTAGCAWCGYKITGLMLEHFLLKKLHNRNVVTLNVLHSLIPTLLHANCPLLEAMLQLSSDSLFTSSVTFVFTAPCSF